MEAQQNWLRLERMRAEVAGMRQTMDWLIQYVAARDGAAIVRGVAMDYGTMTAVAFGVVTLVLLAWLVLQRRPGSVDEAQAALAQAADLARVAVAAAEQLYRTGKLPDNDAKLDYALGLLEAQFPALESEQLVATIGLPSELAGSGLCRAMPHDERRDWPAMRAGAAGSLVAAAWRCCAGFRMSCACCSCAGWIANDFA